MDEERLDEERLGEVTFPFDAVVCDVLNEWLTMYSASHGSTQELLLVNALTFTSVLIGKTTVKVFGTYEVPGNLFMIGTIWIRKNSGLSS